MMFKVTVLEVHSFEVTVDADNQEEARAKVEAMIAPEGAVEMFEDPQYEYTLEATEWPVETVE